MANNLVASRTCGDCTVCCKVLKIDAPDLRKASGVTCTFLRKGQGCSKYADRPDVCRTWYCGWRRFEWMDTLARPDRCGILVRLVDDGIPPNYSGGFGVAFEVLRTQVAFRSAGIVEAISTVIDDNIAAFLIVPGPPGFAATRVFLNDHLRGPIGQRDRNAVLAKLDEAHQVGLATPKEWIGS